MTPPRKHPLSTLSSPAAFGVGLTLLAACCLGASVAPTAPTPAAPVQFVRDIAPILDKKGCSTAGCHGKFGGRGGFQLSLLTLSPWDDYDPIVRGAKNRRVNFAEPEKSLLLLKATGAVPHGGGQRFAVGSPEYVALRGWIAAGAPFDAATDAHLTKLTVTPAARLSQPWERNCPCACWRRSRTARRAT